MDHFKHVKYIILLLAIPFLLWGILGRGQSGNFLLAHSFTDASYQANICKIFSNSLHIDTKESVHIDLVNVEDKLWPTSEIKEAVRQGKYAFGTFFLDDLGMESPIFSVGSLPFLSNNYKQARVLWHVTRYHIAKHLKKSQLLYLFSIPSEPQSFFVPQKLKNAEDLKSLKVRAYGERMKEFVGLLGAIPVGMRENKTYRALREKRVDAFMGGKNAAYQAEVISFAPYYYPFNCSVPQSIVVIHEEVFAKLSAENQQKLLMQAQTMENIGWKMSQADNYRKEAFFQKEAIPPWLMKKAQEAALMMLKEWMHQTGNSGKRILRQYHAHLEEKLIEAPALLKQVLGET